MTDTAVTANRSTTTPERDSVSLAPLSLVDEVSRRLGPDEPITWRAVRETVAALAGGVQPFDLEAHGDARVRWPFESTTLAAAILRADAVATVLVPVDETAVAPYHFARYIAALGYIGPGRFTLALRQPADARAAARQNEYLEVVRALWNSWPQSLIEADKASGRFFAAEDVHDIAFVGEFFSVRGPLNLPTPLAAFPDVIPFSSLAPKADS